MTSGLVFVLDVLRPLSQQKLSLARMALLSEMCLFGSEERR